MVQEEIAKYASSVVKLCYLPDELYSLIVKRISYPRCPYNKISNIPIFELIELSRKNNIPINLVEDVDLSGKNTKEDVVFIHYKDMWYYNIDSERFFYH